MAAPRANSTARTTTTRTARTRKVAAAPAPAPVVWPLPHKSTTADGWYVAWSRPFHALLKRTNADGQVEWLARMSDGTDLPARLGSEAQALASNYQRDHGLAGKARAAAKAAAPVAAAA